LPHPAGVWWFRERKNNSLVVVRVGTLWSPGHPLL
jgi:hypothetical protein